MTKFRIYYFEVPKKVLEYLKLLKKYLKFLKVLEYLKNISSTWYLKYFAQFCDKVICIKKMHYLYFHFFSWKFPMKISFIYLLQL